MDFVLIFLSILGLGLIFFLLGYFVWTRGNIKWLNNIGSWIIYSYPFERIPSLSTALGPIRIGQVLILGGLFVFLVLIIKKDPQVLAKKIGKFTAWIALFFFGSLPSFFFVLNIKRFLVAYIATFLVFASVFLIAHFVDDIWVKFKNLVLIFIGLGVFTLYQFLGDMANLPIYLTGIKPLFQSHIFGIPRVHATFNEPSYFANALFFIIFSFLFLSTYQKNAFTFKAEVKNWRQKIINVFYKNYQLVYAICLSGFTAAFLITIAKSAWVVAPIIIIPVLYFAFYDISKQYLNKLTNYIINILLAFSFILLVVLPFSYEHYQGVFANIVDNVGGSFTGKSATSNERSTFLDTALEIIPYQALTGIGSGQFGTYAIQYLGGSTDEISYKYIDILSPKQQVIPKATEVIETTIVFNVYAEVLLEFGLISFIAFIGLFLSTLVHNFKRISQSIKSRDNLVVLRLILGFYLIASLLQWNFISPIYINPIFIALGMLLNIDLAENKSQIEYEN